MDIHAFIAWLDPKELISAFGLLGVIIIVFLETGFLIGFFFPGDSLLFTAGFLASAGHMPIGWLLLGSFLAAVAGDSVSYALGKRMGPKLFTREDSLFFDKRHIARAQHFYEKHGGKALVLARFMPIVRTFAPVVAGVGSMSYRTFFIYNVIGGLLWTGALLGFGYGFGSLIPDPDQYILPVIIGIILMSALPVVRELLKKRTVQ